MSEPLSEPADATTAAPCNIAFRLRGCAERLPGKRAVIEAKPRGAEPSWTFAELDRESDAIARGFRRIGITRGTKTLLMVRPGLNFYAVTFALFKVGAVPVMIDPGMGIGRLLECIASVAPEAMVGIPLAHLMRVLRPGPFSSMKHFVTVGRRWLWGGHTLAGISEHDDKPLPLEATRPDELAAILFTTGSTGPAKGVEYEHGMFEGQCELIQAAYGIGAEDIDLPTFPLFGLFSVGLGMTAVIPAMNPTKPGSVDPARVLDPIRKHGCTFCFGSPALWGRVSAHADTHGVKLPTLRKVLMAGAPVPPVVHERLLLRILPEGAETHTPYGATESLPTTDMTGSEVLRETAALTRDGRGTCVGRPVPGMEVRVIALTDEPIAEWSESLVLPTGALGEIVTKGPTVTKAYHQRPEANALAKIRDGDTVRHRMGDLGYFDDQGRLWFCGRKSHRVETAEGLLPTVCCEAIFNQLPWVRRSALVGIGERPDQRPVIILELEKSAPGRNAEERARIALNHGQSHALTREIRDVLFHKSFPVDIRHNAKIFREELTTWAAARYR